ncbi:MAG: SDR family NAD(P)-dependent oxidoreductase [Anaerolineaceae bacterium]|nr:SDR family NAD(P)-dependent oxidoreductase [Anaerolineaceae bacterium]
MEAYTSMGEEICDRVMNVNLKAIYLTAKELVPVMKTNGWGRIISVSAGSAYVRIIAYMDWQNSASNTLRKSWLSK